MNIENEKALPKRKSTRLKGFDYSSAGAYFVTICTKDRKRILSHIVKPSSPVGVGAHDDPLYGALDDPLTPQIQLTEIGKIVEKYLLSSEKIPGVKIDQYVIMPDHIHAIIFVYPDEYTSCEDGSSRAPTHTNGSSKAPTLPVRCYRILFPRSNAFAIKKSEITFSNADIWSTSFVAGRITRRAENISMRTLRVGITNIRMNKSIWL